MDNMRQFYFNSTGDGTNFPVTKSFSISMNPEEGFYIIGSDGTISSTINLNATNIGLSSNSITIAASDLTSSSFLDLTPIGTTLNQPLTLNSPVSGYNTKLQGNSSSIADVDLQLPTAPGTLALKEFTIPLSGTEVGKPVTGDIIIDMPNDEVSHYIQAVSADLTSSSSVRFTQNDVSLAQSNPVNNSSISASNVGAGLYTWNNLGNATSLYINPLTGLNIDYSNGTQYDVYNIVPATLGTTSENHYLKLPIQNGNLALEEYVDTKVTAVKPYKVYTALLTQTGTTAPVATVLENTIGNIVWTYDSTGFYFATLAGAFISGKTTLTVDTAGDY